LIVSHFDSHGLSQDRWWEESDAGSYQDQRVFEAAGLIELE